MLVLVELAGIRVAFRGNRASDILEAPAELFRFSSVNSVPSVVIACWGVSPVPAFRYNARHEP